MKRFFQLLFMPCEGIAAHISESLDRELSGVERFGVRLHILYCRACRHYRKQTRVIRAILQMAEDALASAVDLRLRPEARERIIQALQSDN